MMKLYYATGACSLSPHIILREAGFPFELERVDLATKKTESGKNYTEISEKSAVPMLQLENGEKITEGAVIVQYLADQKPEAGLAPKQGSFERVRLNEWMNFIASDVHKSFYVFFKGADESAKALYQKKLDNHFTYLSQALKDRPYLMGNNFTVADAYLYTILTWARGLKMALGKTLEEYMARVEARPHVQEALKTEGLLKKAA